MTQSAQLPPIAVEESSATTDLSQNLLAELAHEYGQLNCVAPVSDLPEQWFTSNAKVMIVEDEPLNIRMFRKSLSDAGLKECIAITDPREAFGKIEQELPDVVLLDLMMPEMNGIDVLKLIRNSKFAQLPVIVLTASSEREIKLEALERGATDFLNKPVDTAELILRVRNALTISGSTIL